jgi:hypothetical protein
MQGLIAVRIGLLIAVVCLATPSCGGSHSSTSVAAHPSVSRVVLGSFILGSRGVVFFMHPTEVRITLAATTNTLLKVCQVRSAAFPFHIWKGGCRHLGHGSLALPSSGGFSHIGFRLAPANGRPAEIGRLVVRWRCVDHFFALEHPATRVRVPAPIFDC